MKPNKPNALENGSASAIDRGMTEKYKWASAQEWLLDKIDNEWSPEEVQAFARQAALAADGDDIQDEFQSDMDAEGFFSPLCEECAEPIHENDEYSHAGSCSHHPDNMESEDVEV